MVPASIARPATGSIGQAADASVSVAWRRANVPFSVRAGLHSLLVWGIVVGALSVVLLLGYVFLKFDTHKMVGLPNHPGWNLVSGVKLKP